MGYQMYCSIDSSPLFSLYHKTVRGLTENRKQQYEKPYFSKASRFYLLVSPPPNMSVCLEGKGTQIILMNLSWPSHL